MNSFNIGDKVKVTSKGHWADKEWGIVKFFDGDTFHVSLWKGKDCIVLDECEMVVVKRNRKGDHHETLRHLR